MDPITILADVQLALQIGKLAMDAGIAAGPYWIRAYDIAFNGLVLTDADRESMRQEEAAMRARIDAVIAADDAATD